MMPSVMVGRKIVVDPEMAKALTERQTDWNARRLAYPFSSRASGWGKKDDDDEEWARKCARQAVKMCKPQMVKHAIAKPRYRHR